MISAQARGQLRIIKRHLGASAVRTNAFLESEAAARLVSRVIHCGAMGSMRAQQKLRRNLPSVNFVARDLAAYLSPSTPSIQDPIDAGQTQPAIAMRYAHLGVPITTSMWTMEFPDHALFRFLDRAPGAPLVPALWEAHAQVLAASTDQLLRCAEYLIPAGPGFFIAETIGGLARDADFAQVFFVRPRTWLHADQLSDSQRQPILEPGDGAVDLFLPIALRPEL